MPPINDSFASATLLSGNSGQLTTSNVDATRETGEPDHHGFAGPASIWFDWTPTSSFEVTISLEGSSFDTVLAVYTGAVVDALTLVADNDDYFGTQSRVRFDAVAGTTYRIAVEGYGGQSGDVALRWGAMSQVTPLPMSYVGHETVTWTGSGGTIPVPAGTEVGDLLVVVMQANWSSSDFDTPAIGPGWSGPSQANISGIGADMHAVQVGDPTSYNILMGPPVFDHVEHDQPGGVAVLMAWRGIEVYTSSGRSEEVTVPAQDSMFTPPNSGLSDRRVILAIYGQHAYAQFSDNDGSHLATVNQTSDWTTAGDPLGNFTFTELVNAAHGLSIKATEPSEGPPNAVGEVNSQRAGEFLYVTGVPEWVTPDHRQMATLMTLHGFVPEEEWVVAPLLVTGASVRMRQRDR
jgi:hypothetical protein